MKLFTSSLLVISLALLSSCGGADAETTEGDETATQGTTYPSGLNIIVNAEGSGPNVVKGEVVSIMYTGKLAATGEVFASNAEQPGQPPLAMPVGVGKWIQGLDEALGYMNKGTKATVTIPAALAYGPQPRPGIPANSDLIFDIEVVDVAPAPEPHMPWAMEESKAVTTKSGLTYYIIEEGTGPKVAPGSRARVHYYGYFAENGQRFDDSYSSGQPMELTVGVGQVIPGWDEGLSLLNQGTKAVLVIPSQLAYGEGGYPGVIPPNATLIFDVEIVAVQQ